jgi:hypothetical protein
MVKSRLHAPRVTANAKGREVLDVLSYQLQAVTFREFVGCCTGGRRGRCREGGGRQDGAEDIVVSGRGVVRAFRWPAHRVRGRHRCR